jgi:Fe2+ transport system protein B
MPAKPVGTPIARIAPAGNPNLGKTSIFNARMKQDESNVQGARNERKPFQTRKEVLK